MIWSWLLLHSHRSPVTNPEHLPLMTRSERSFQWYLSSYWYGFQSRVAICCSSYNWLQKKAYLSVFLRKPVAKSLRMTEVSLISSRKLTSAMPPFKGIKESTWSSSGIPWAKKEFLPELVILILLIGKSNSVWGCLATNEIERIVTTTITHVYIYLYKFFFTR